MKIIYETDRLLLCSSEAIRDQWFVDQEVCKYSSHGKLTERKLSNLDPEKNVCWDVWLRPQTDLDVGVLIGRVSLMDIDWLNRKAEFSCIFGEKKYWGQGYAYEAMHQLFHHGFFKLGLNRIWLGTAQWNNGMVKLADKMGMEYEGCLSEDVYLDGTFTDVCRYGMTRKLWDRIALHKRVVEHNNNIV